MYPNWLQKSIIDQNVFSNQFLKIGFSPNGEDDLSGLLGKDTRQRVWSVG
jgi:hypothetical protein